MIVWIVLEYYSGKWNNERDPFVSGEKADAAAKNIEMIYGRPTHVIESTIPDPPNTYEELIGKA